MIEIVVFVLNHVSIRTIIRCLIAFFHLADSHKSRSSYVSTRSRSIVIEKGACVLLFDLAERQVNFLMVSKIKTQRVSNQFVFIFIFSIIFFRIFFSAHQQNWCHLHILIAIPSLGQFPFYLVFFHFINLISLIT